ncbi:L-lactate dehydrogenase [cytochrome] [bacterium BMS3Bbin10]|nr:L-lactate dehydrogenase [cytochrome] [bacterium BMS3Bbin10]
MTGNSKFEVLHEFVEPARANLSPETWDYLMGGAETETSLNRNRMSIDALALRPRVLRNVEHVDLSGKFLGSSWRLPVLLAPIGSLQDMTKGGGKAPARAAAKFGVAHMLSSSCAPGLEEVAAAAPQHPKIFQIYVRGDAGWLDELVRRAIDHGYMAICFTVDLDTFGRRERDIAKRYLTTARRKASGEEHQARFCWSDVERIKKKFDIPLILKGIATPGDAARAAGMGIDAVYVSNHGGRQLDHVQGSTDVLPEIVEKIAGRAEIIVDGGYMRGSDIVKAIALGADAVGIGRLQGLAAAAGGEDAIIRMLEILEQEIKHCLMLLGVTSFAELDPSFVTRVTPLQNNWLDSAFPLLREGY